MGKQWNTVSDFILLGSKITVDGDCSHEIKRHLLLGRKVMTNLDSIFKSRDIELWTEVCDIVQERGIKTSLWKRNAKKKNGCLRSLYK